MRHRAFRALILLVGVLPAAAAAQTVRAPALSGLMGAAGAAYESYGFGDAQQSGIDRISLFTAPFGARARLFGGSSLEIAGAYASARLTRADGSGVTLSGLTDTQVSVSVPVRAEVATLTAVAILPTGSARMTMDEALVAGIVASELLPFRISSWGTGGAAGVSGAVAHSLGPVGIGASASYLLGHEYDLLRPQSFAYRPGNQLRARLVLDVAAGPAGKASLQMTYLHSGEDKVAGTNIFRAGDRLQAIGSYAFRARGGASGIAYAGLVHRDRGTYLVQLVSTPSPQNLFLAGGGMRVLVRGALLLPSVDLRVLRRSDGMGEGEIVGVGSGAELRLRPGVTLQPNARARFGRVMFGPSSSSGFTGVDLGVGLRFGAGVP